MTKNNFATRTAAAAAAATRAAILALCLVAAVDVLLLHHHDNGRGRVEAFCLLPPPIHRPQQQIRVQQQHQQLLVVAVAAASASNSPNSPVEQQQQQQRDDDDAAATTTATATTTIDERFQLIASKVGLEQSRCYGGGRSGDGGRWYHLISKDKLYGWQDLQTSIHLSSSSSSSSSSFEHDPKKDQGLGLVLEELMGNERAGIVCVRDVFGPAAAAYPAIEPGDIIVSVSVSSSSSSSNDDKSENENNEFCETMTGYNYDQTVQALTQAKQAAEKQQQQQQGGGGGGEGVLMLELNRLVKRAKIQIELIDYGGKRETFEALAGDNLRQVIQRQKDITLGTCGGEGQCGGCMVQMMGIRQDDHDDDNSSPPPTQPQPQQQHVQRKKSCQTIIGTDNKPQKLQVTLMPDTDEE